MGSDTAKDKRRAKLEKKRAKAELKARKKGRSAPPPTTATTSGSAAVRYAETIRGVLYVVTGGSLVAALALGERGAMLSLDDLIDGLFAARAGKVVLAAIAVALVIYGLKHLRVLR